MRLGIGSYAFAWAIGIPGRKGPRPMCAIGLVEKAAALGVQLVQIDDNLPLHTLSGAEREALAKRATELGVAIEVGTRGIELAHLHRYLRIARRFGSSILRVVTDTGEQRPSPDEVVERIGSAAAEFELAGVTLALENHDRLQAKTLAQIIERLNSCQVGICLDTVNSFGALEGPQAVVDVLARYVVNLHIKDFSIRRYDHQMGFAIEGAPAGRGRLDVPWLLDRLRSAGRDPSAILELWTPPESTIEATIAKEGGWAAESIRYLRTLISE